MKKFIAGVAVTMGAIAYAGWMYKEGRKDVAKELVEKIDLGCNVEELIQKLREEG